MSLHIPSMMIGAVVAALGGFATDVLTSKMHENREDVTYSASRCDIVDIEDLEPLEGLTVWLTVCSDEGAWRP